jgi:hypothetical protein
LLISEIQKEENPESQVRELAHSSDTRWMSRALAADKVLLMYGAILKTLHFFKGDKDVATRTQAFGLSAQLKTKKLLFSLIAFNRVFQLTNQATVGLQKASLTCDVLLDLLSVCKDSLKDLRSNDASGFTKTASLAEEIAQKHGVGDETARPQRQTHPSSRLDASIVEHSCGQREKQDESFFRRLWYSLLDNIIGEMDSRFGGEQSAKMLAADACRPGSTNFMKMELLLPVCSTLKIELGKPHWLFA